MRFGCEQRDVLFRRNPAACGVPWVASPPVRMAGLDGLRYRVYQERQSVPQRSIVRALVILLAVASALTCASAFADPAPLRAAPVATCKNGAVRDERCICQAGQHLVWDRCEAAHTTAAAADAHRRPADCLHQESEELAQAESLREAAAEERQAANAFRHDAAPNQINPTTIARAGHVGDRLTPPTITLPSSPAGSSSSPPCPPSNAH